MSTGTTDKVLDSVRAKSGFTPAEPVPQDDAIKAFGALIGEDDEPKQRTHEDDLRELGLLAESETPPAAEQPAATETVDVERQSAEALLAAQGWTADELRALSKDRVLRLAQPIAPASAAAPAAQASTGDTADIDAAIDALGLDAAKTKGLRDLVGGLAKQTQATREQQLASMFVDRYPEVQKAEVRLAVKLLADRIVRAGESDESVAQRALEVMYGKRTQSRAERLATQAQLAAQPELPGRTSRPPAPSKDAAKMAAFGELQRSGNVENALRVRRELGG